MKERDLMIGDLVYNHRKWICPVIAISEDSVTVIAHHYGECTYRWEDIYPIDLTDDIIKQLGWEEISETDLTYKHGLGVGKQYKHPWYIDELNIISNSLTDMPFCKHIAIPFVHRLQHILNLTVKDKIILDDNSTPNHETLSIKCHRIWEDEVDIRQ